MTKETIKELLAEIGNIKLIAVSKKKSVDEIKQAVEAGVKIIGENRIQEAEQKYTELKNYFKEKNVDFHFVGHLQTNKVKKAVEMFDLIQTVDSLKLVKEINKRAKQMNKVQDVLIEVNIGKEPQKHGVMPENVIDFVEEFKQFNNINVKGLMCIPPYEENPRPHFKQMKNMFNELNLELLSMGMSSDYKIAIEEGSNMVRIGTKIFGERKY